MNWPTGLCTGVRGGGEKPGFCRGVEGNEEIFPMKVDFLVVLCSQDPGGGGPSETLAKAFAVTFFQTQLSQNTFKSEGTLLIMTVSRQA